MLDHIGIGVSDFARARNFYDKALAPLSIALVTEITAQEHGGHPAAGYGSEGNPYFWFGGDEAIGEAHIAFAAKNRASVDAFYKAATSAGGRDNGAPGLRPQYHVNYYAAFVLDPDGHNIEAVCHLPE